MFFGLLGYLNPSYKLKINRLEANIIGGKLNETLFELFSFFMHLIKKGEYQIPVYYGNGQMKPKILDKTSKEPIT